MLSVGELGGNQVRKRGDGDQLKWQPIHEHTQTGDMRSTVWAPQCLQAQKWNVTSTGATEFCSLWKSHRLTRMSLDSTTTPKSPLPKFSLAGLANDRKRRWIIRCFVNESALCVGRRHIDKRLHFRIFRSCKNCARVNGDCMSPQVC